MSLARTLLAARWLAVALVLVPTALARADISPPLPLPLHVRRVSAVADETTAPAADVARVIDVVTTRLRRQVYALERCMDAHTRGWPSYDPQRARARLVWDRAEAPTETTLLTTSFTVPVSECIRSVLPALTISPAPAGRVVLTVDFVRSDR